VGEAELQRLSDDLYPFVTANGVDRSSASARLLRWDIVRAHLLAARHREPTTYVLFTIG
jgi:hypothetical protein